MASLLPYKKVQRQDGGFDFYNKNKKIDVNQYVQATGSNKNQLVQDMANTGDRVSQSYMKIAEPTRRNLFAQDAKNQQQKAEIFSLGNVIKDISKSGADLGKMMLGGIQQGAGVVSDVALQGGAMVGNAGIQTNPLISQAQREKQTQQFDRRLIGANGTEAARKQLQSLSDINGGKILGTSDVDQNATNIATGRGTAQDVLAVAGKSLDAGLSATMFANPVALARGAAGNMTGRQVLNFAAKDALMFGGTQGVATGAQVYGQTGDLGQAIQQGATAGALTGLTQGTMDGLGLAARALPKNATDVKIAGKQIATKAQDINRAVEQVNPAIKQIDDTLAQYQKAFDVEANPTRRNQISKGMAELSSQRRSMLQGGYVKVPGGKPSLEDAQYINKTVAETSSPEAFRQNMIDTMWEQNKKGSGVDSWLTEASIGEGSGYTGRSAMTNNGKFYSDFYREYGRKPTKTAIADMVDQHLGIKDTGDYRNLITPEDGSPYDSSIYAELKNRSHVIEPTPQVAKTAPAASDVPTLKASVQAGQTVAKSLPPQRQVLPTEKPNLRALEESTAGSQPDILDTQLPQNHTYPNNTPELNTKQYVAEMSKAQKTAGQGRSKAGTAVSDFKATMIDDLSPIEDRLNKAIKNGAQVDPKDHITYQLDRSRRAEGITHAFIKDKGLAKIIQDVPNPKEFDQYLIARHSKELDESITTGRNATKDAQLVQALDGKYSKYAEELYKYNRNLLNTSVSYGLISKETASALKKQYPDYVPFNRIFKEDELVSIQGNGKADASISKQSAVQKIKGSSRAISSPLNSIIDKTRVVVEQGERNKAAKLLADYKNLEGNPFDLKEIPASETIGTRHTIAYLDKGVKRVFEVDEEIAEAAKHMSREQIGMIGRIVAVPARVLRAGATGVNVGFAGANIVKDVIGAAINSKHPVRIADPRNFGKALSAALHHNGKNYQELMREGIAGTSFDMYRNALKSNVGEIRSQKNLATRSARNLLPQHWYRTLENTIGRSEDFGRALQYYSNKSGFKAEGMSDLDARILAGDQARNNSTNFFRAGSAGKHINTAVPYFNAGVQGARIQIRRIKERPAQTLGKMAAVIALPSAMIAVNNYSNEKNRAVIEQIPEYEKKGNIIIVGANAKYNEETREWDDVYKIPVPPQHSGLHNAVQKAVESAYTGKEYDLISVLGGLSENYATVDPTDARAIANKLTPQALKLIAEPMTNTNFFTNNKIVPDSQKNLPAKDQVGNGTSGTAKVIGNLTNLSPRVLDNTIRTSTGGAGQNLVNLTDSALSGVGAIKKEEIRGTSVPDSVTGRFVGANKTPTSDRIEKQFKDLKETVINSTEYKDATAYDKQRMLNRLESDVSAIEYNADGYGSGKLTTKQKAMKEGGFNLETYTNLDATTETAKLSPAEKYKKAQDDYNKGKGEMSDIKRYATESSLKRMKVAAPFSQDVLDLYGMSKEKIYDFVTNSKDGNKLVAQITAYDKALKDAGLSKYLKFKTGIASATKGSRGGRRKSGGSVAKSKAPTGLKEAMSATQAIRVPKTALAQSSAPSTPTQRKIALRTYNASKSNKIVAKRGVSRTA